MADKRLEQYMVLSGKSVYVREELLMPGHRKNIGKSIWLMFYLAENPDATPRQMAWVFDMPTPLVKRKLLTLAELGYIEMRDEYRKKARKVEIPPAIRWAVWERDDFTCQRCGVRQFLATDHIVPESKGGKATMENLQTLCKPCNSRKGSK